MELTDSVLERIDTVEARPHACVTLIADTTRLAAARAEQEIARGLYRGPLHGVPMALKDLIGTAGVATTVKHFVANDAETERFTVNNVVGPRALRELYLAPFERIVKRARPWDVMAAYNSVNGPTMTEHHHLQNEVLRGEWGFDGFIVSDWFAARDTVRAISGGLDVAMPGPRTVYGEALAAAVRGGDVAESLVDDSVRNVLRLAARVGALEGVPAATAPGDLPSRIDGRALTREVAHRAFVLVRNDNRVLPMHPASTRSVAVIGTAAREVRVLGGGSAQVFPESIVSPLEGLRAALPHDVEVTYAVGADPSEELAVADGGFALRAIVRSADGSVLGEEDLPNGMAQWHGDFPDGVRFEEMHTVEVWDEQDHGWRLIPGTYTAETGHSLNDLRLRTEVEVTA